MSNSISRQIVRISIAALIALTLLAVVAIADLSLDPAKLRPSSRNADAKTSPSIGTGSPPASKGVRSGDRVKSKTPFIPEPFAQPLDAVLESTALHTPGHAASSALHRTRAHTRAPPAPLV